MKDKQVTAGKYVEKYQHLHPAEPRPAMYVQFNDGTGVYAGIFQLYGADAFKIGWSGGDWCEMPTRMLDMVRAV